MIETLPSPPGLLIIGGESVEGPLSSAETFGLENCTVPPLPETRYGHAAFLTSSQQLAVCGGWWEGKPRSTDCLVLNKTSGQWERGLLGELHGQSVRGVVSTRDGGIYIIHETDTSYLSASSTIWVSGPTLPFSTECSCKISESTFVVVGGFLQNSVREYAAISDNPTSNKGWQGEDLWPTLKTGRKGPGCAATDTHLIVAGGMSGWQEVLSTVEIIQLKSKALGRGENMKQARAFFSIAVVGETHQRLLAIGGQDTSSYILTTEFWGEEEDEWETGPSLGRARSSSGVVSVSADIACSATATTQNYFCPTTDGNICMLSSGGGSKTKDNLTNLREQKLFLAIFDNL